MLKRTIALLLAVIAVLGVSVAGCGGGDGSAEGDTIETSSLTKAQFIKKAEDICIEGTDDTLELIGDYVAKNESPGMSEEELIAEAFRETIVPTLETQVDEIESLGAPSGDEAQVEAYLDAQRRSISAVGEQKTLNLATDFSTAFRKPGTLARQYGMSECAYN